MRNSIVPSARNLSIQSKDIQLSFAFPKAPSGHFAIVGSAQGPGGGTSI